MKKMILGTAAVFALLFIGSGLVLADDSVNIKVSCTIPAIPGLNAPLLETQSIAVNPATENRQIAMGTQPEPPVINIQEETEKKGQSSEGEKDIVLVKTFYVR